MEKMVAIGEIGLDYYWHKEEAEHKQQQEMFRAQMDIAREAAIYDASSTAGMQPMDTLEIVKEYMKKICPAESFTVFPTVRRLRRNI